MKRKGKGLKNEPQAKEKVMNRQYKEQKPLPLTLPLTIVLPDGTHKVITEEDLPELPVKTEDLDKLDYPIKKEEDQAVIDFDDVNEVKEEEPPPAKRGRKDDWTKTSYIKLENAEKELQRMKKKRQMQKRTRQLTEKHKELLCIPLSTQGHKRSTHSPP